jgi:hypothetical protein
MWKTELPSTVKIWLAHYGRALAFEKPPIYELDLFPASKLVLFLHRQLLHDAKLRRRFMRRRLLPWRRPGMIVRSIKQRPAVLFDPQWRHRQFLLHRAIFHTTSGLRYLCEIPRWLWLNRSKVA